MEVEKFIRTAPDIKERVAQDLGLSEGAMSLAMNFKRHSEKSQEARRKVLEHSESQIMVCAPLCETIFLKKEFGWTQYFENGWVITVRKGEGSTGAYRYGVKVYNDKGEEYATCPLADFDGYERIQDWVQGMPGKGIAM